MAETHSSKVQPVRPKAWGARGQGSGTSRKDRPAAPSHFTLQAGFSLIFFLLVLFLMSSLQKLEEKIN